MGEVLLKVSCGALSSQQLFKAIDLLERSQLLSSCIVVASKRIVLGKIVVHVSCEEIGK
jgi:hypothetical protein